MPNPRTDSPRRLAEALEPLVPRSSIRAVSMLQNVSKALVEVSAAKYLGRGAAAKQQIASHRASKIVPGLGIQVEVHGEPPADENGPTLVLTNHRSYLDIPVLLSLYPTSFLAKQEVRKWPLFGKIAEDIGTVFVERDKRSSRKQALASVAEQLRDNTRLTAFPEGTTFQGPLHAPLRHGLFHLAADANLKIKLGVLNWMPQEAAWIGDDTFVTHFSRTMKHRTLFVEVVFGPTLQGNDGSELHAETTQWMTEQLSRLNREKP